MSSKRSGGKGITFAALNKMFKGLDVDGDGNISRAELKGPIMKLDPSLTAAKFEKMYTDMDKDGSDGVDLKELCAFYKVEYKEPKKKKDEDEGEMSDDDILAQLLKASEEAEAEQALAAMRTIATAPASPPKSKEKKMVTRIIVMPTTSTKTAPSPEVLFLQAADMADKKEMNEYIKGGDCGICTDKGETALHKAARGGMREMCASLMGKVDINYQDKAGKTAAFFAAEYGHGTTLKLLIDCSVDLNIRNNQGWTVLHQAVSKGNVECVKLLLDLVKSKKVDFNITDNSGRTSLHIASFSADEKIVAMLLEAGADASIEDKSKNSAVGLAKRSGRRKSEDLLAQAAELAKLAEGK